MKESDWYRSAHLDAMSKPKLKLYTEFSFLTVIENSATYHFLRSDPMTHISGIGGSYFNRS